MDSWSREVNPGVSCKVVLAGKSAKMINQATTQSLPRGGQFR